jgi:phosphate transport system substrate-binding protein
MTAINNALKKSFEEKFAGTTVNLATNGTDAAIRELLAGNLDIAALGRALTTEEKDKGLTEVPVSREKIAIIVGADNPFQGSLTGEQFARIFRGEITNWSEVGGPDAPIRLIDRPASSDTRQALSKYPVFQAAPFQTGATATQVAQDDTAAIAKQLNRNGISYAIVSQAESQPGVRVLEMHKTPPSDARYPFSQLLGYAYRGEPNPAVQAFLGYAASTPGQANIQQAKAQQAPAASPGVVVVPGGAVSPPPTATTSPSPAASPPPTATVSPSPAMLTETVSPAPAATTSPSPAVPQAETAPAPAAIGTQPDRSPLWWLLLPLVGLPLLLWWAKGRGAAVPPVATARAQASRMILTPRNCQNAYAYWEVPAEHFEEARQQGGRQLKVRLHDVTDVSGSVWETRPPMREFSCTESAQDLHLPIAVDDRDYLAELGYVAENGRWIKLVHSDRVRVPACVPIGNGGGVATAAATGGTALVTAAAARAAATGSVDARVMTEPSRMIMVPRSTNNAYVYWEVSEAQKAALKQQGGQRMMLRIHDTPNGEVSQPSSQNFRQYECDEQAQDQHVPIPTSDRNYVAELGYLTDDNRWFSLAHSAPVHVPAVPSAAGASVSVQAQPAAMLAEDLHRSEQPAEAAVKSITDRLGDASQTVSQWVDEAPQAMGAAIAGATAAVGLGAAGQVLLDRKPTAEPNQLEMSPGCRIILVPLSSKDAYAYWEVANSYKQAAREQGGRKLMLRIHDATNIDIDFEPPHNTLTYVCSETNQDKHVAIPVSDRDYIAELGYFTDDDRWLRIIRSFHVRVPA